MTINQSRSAFQLRDAGHSLVTLASCVLCTGVLAVAGCGTDGDDDSVTGDAQYASGEQGGPVSSQPGEHEVKQDVASTREPADAHEYTNRLVHSTSPYLLQHAHNPVDWYPWGEEALERAKREKKPIFLSVGYSTCYWCHVMEREVFENPDIAELMNDLFINIKVDREQRPDLDEIYMMATRLMTRGGGWPNSVFLTPDLRPFYAGTYFGPEDQAGRPGFPTLIRAISDAWASRQSEVLASAERAADAIRQTLSEPAETVDAASLTVVVPDRAVSQLAARYDPALGGFGGAPKFPQDFYYEFLFDIYDRTGNQRTSDMALRTLRMMAAGGIYDHVGGGFHRYATDAQWRVPHFEKMLYNQDPLVRAYVSAYESTGEASFADVVRDILQYVAELMTGPNGQFYSALDAETDAVEGAYYVWKRSEVQDVLSSEANELFDSVFALGAVPEFPGHKHPDGGVLYMRKPISDVARDLEVPSDDLRFDLDELLSMLKSQRDKRKLPRLDDKVIAGWNGMMISAYAYAGEALDDASYIRSAERAAQFVLAEMRDGDGRLLRIWRKGVAEQPAFQEDYAFLINGLMALYKATNDAQWLEESIELAHRADELFWDEEHGGYYFAQASPDLIARSKSIRDAAIPSGNSAMLHNLVDLWQATGDAFWKQRVEQLLGAFGGSLSAAPSAHIHMVHALEQWLRLRDGQSSNATSNRLDVTLPDVGERGGTADSLDGTSYVTVGVQPVRARIKPGAVFLVHVDLTVADGWHVNANPASDPDLIPTMVDLRSGDVDVQAGGAAVFEVVSITYPEGHELKAVYADRPLSVLEGKTRTTITGRLKESVAPGTNISLNVFIQYQACDDARCLPPSEHIEQIQIEVIE